MSKQKEVISYGAVIRVDAEKDIYVRAAPRFVRSGDVRNWILRTFCEHAGVDIAEYYDDGTWDIAK